MVGILSRIKNIGSFYLYFLKVMITKFQNILLDGFLFILIFSFSCGHKNTSTSEIPKQYSPQQVEGVPNEFLLFRFHFKQDSVTLLQIKRYSGKMPQVPQKLEGEDYQLLLLDSLDRQLFVRYFPAPGKRYYDQADSTGKNLSGGQVILPESTMELKIPFFQNLQILKMISPQQIIIWQTNREYINEAIKD